MHSLIENTKKNVGVFLFIAFVATVMSLGFTAAIQFAGAHQDPVACNASGLQQFPSIVSPSGNAFDGDTITYAVTYVNSDPDGAGGIAPCNVTGANADLLLPNGANIDVLTNATLNVGDPSIVCPGGAGCAAGPYTYVVNHANEVGTSVTATFDIAGVLHQDANEEAASDHDTLSKSIEHPSTITTIASSDDSVLAGGTVDLTVTEQNDGDVDLTAPSVVVNDGSSDIATLVAPPTSGDDGDGVLEVGETWSWTISDVVVSANTTFTATGSGTVSGNSHDVTWCSNPQIPPELTICDQDEQDSVDVDVINPSTITTITSSSSEVQDGGTVDLTITEENDGSGDLTGANVVVDNGVGTLNSASVGFSGDDADGILEAGETWQWIVNDVVISGDTTFTATGHGTIDGMDVTFCTDPQTPPANTICDQDEQDEVRVTTANPSTITTIESSASEVGAGGTVNLTVTEENDGNVNLTNVSVDVDNGVGTLDENSANFSGDDGDDILEPGETWQWIVNNVIVNADTTFTATGHGTDSLGNDVTFCSNGGAEDIICDQDEQDSVSVTVREVEWCSPGYWKNHPDEADIAAEAGGFSMDDTYSSQFGGVPPMKSKGVKDGAPADPTLREVLDHPQWYGGDAFNKVGDLLSEAHPDVDFEEGDTRIENCPLN